MIVDAGCQGQSLGGALAGLPGAPTIVYHDRPGVAHVVRYFRGLLSEM